jgi:hypothetical protein
MGVPAVQNKHELESPHLTVLHMREMPTYPLSPRHDIYYAAALVTNGVLSTATAAWFACRSPLHAKFPLDHRLLASAGYVIFSALVGVAITWALRRYLQSTLGASLGTEYASGPQLPFGVLVLHAGAIWVLIPPIALLLWEDSRWAISMMILASLAAAVCMRALVPAPLDLPSQESQSPAAVSLAMPPVPYSGFWYALAAAVGIEGSALPFAKREILTAGLLLGLAAFALHWRIASTPKATQRPPERDTRPVARLVSALALAILVTIFTLVPQLRDGLMGAGFLGGLGKNAKNHPVSVARKHTRNAAMGSGYKGIILWTVPEKKKEIPLIAPPVLSRISPADQRPLTIPFDGQYWYFQPPYKSPGAEAHVFHDDPAVANIRSTNWLPLLMEAHENLGSSIDLARCRELQVYIRNGDNHPGSVVLGVILSNSNLPGKPSLSLGGQPVVSTQPSHFTIKTSPAEEVLHYAIPARPRIDRFDQITIVFFPASERSLEGAKIGIQQFELIAR